MRFAAPFVCCIRLSQCFLVEFAINSPDIGDKGAQNTDNILDYAINLKQYGFDADRATSLKFKVQACRTAKVILTKSPSSDSMLPLYQIKFGTTSVRVMRRIMPFNFERDTFNLEAGDGLDCLLFKPYWISWGDGNITVGVGEAVDNEVVGRFVDAEPFPMRGANILNSYGDSGIWKVLIKVTDQMGIPMRFITCSPGYKAELSILDEENWSLVACSLYCSTNLSCKGFNFNDAEERCQLLTFGPGITSYVTKTQITGWTFISKCYMENAACVGCLL